MMRRILNVVYGVRYNTILLISGWSAIGWAIFLLYSDELLNRPIYSGFSYLGEDQWLWIMLFIGLCQWVAMFFRRQWFKRLAFILGTFCWGFVTASFWFAEVISTGVIIYSIMTLSCFFASLDTVMPGKVNKL